MSRAVSPTTDRTTPTPGRRAGMVLPGARPSRPETVRERLAEQLGRGDQLLVEAAGADALALCGACSGSGITFPLLCPCTILRDDPVSDCPHCDGTGIPTIACSGCAGRGVVLLPRA